MAIGSALTHGVRTLARRDFWTFRVIHAVLGGVVTVAGAGSALFATDQIKKDLSYFDSMIAQTNIRIDAFERGLSHFELLHTQGVILGGLALGDTMRQEFREHFLRLGVTAGQGPTLRLLRENYSGDDAKYAQFSAKYQELHDAIQLGYSKEAREALQKFEFGQQAEARDGHTQIYNLRFQLQEHRKKLEGSLATATVWGFVLQQLGFVIVLLAGLIHRNDSSNPRPEPVRQA